MQPKLRWMSTPEERRLHSLRWDLEEGRWAYLNSNDKKALGLLRKVLGSLIVEPPLDSEEYREGEEREEQILEQEEEETGEISSGYDPVGGEDPRDSDGYLIR